MRNKKNQAILARDMIDMIRKYADDADVLEYLEGFNIGIADILGGFTAENISIVNWYDIAGVCDQRYYSIKYSNHPIPLNTDLLDKCEKQIQPYLPVTRSDKS